MTKKANKILIALGLLTLAFVITSGCKKGEQSSPQPQPKPQASGAPTVQKPISSAKKPEQEHLLDFSSRKDPFKPFANVPVPELVKVRAVKRSGTFLPIQSYDVSKFVLMGIITGFKENSAMVVDPTGKGYVVKEGMLIGNNDGRIVKISASSISVVEQYRDDNDRIRKRTIVLTLKKK
jgi:type IV pilus assembly protein PilP